MGGSIWQKDSLITHILFEPGMPILIFSPVQIIMGHPLLLFKENVNTYSVTLVVEVVTPTVESGFEIAVWDNFGKFEAESGFSDGLELFFAVEASISINFSTPLASDIDFCS